MQIETIVAQFPDLERGELLFWIEQRWIQPEVAGSGDWVFHEIDIARVRLIYDLRRDLGASPEAVPLVLSLLDQVYELRCLLKQVARAVMTLPPEARERIAAALGSDQRKA
jgi:chaperone modulatory protein CbpM